MRYPFQSTCNQFHTEASGRFAFTWYRCTGMKFSLRENNRGELTTVWLAPTWHFVVVSRKQIQSNNKEPGLTRAGAKVAPARCHENTRLPHVR